MYGCFSTVPFLVHKVAYIKLKSQRRRLKVFITLGTISACYVSNELPFVFLSDPCGSSALAWPRNDTKCGATCADSVTCHSGVTRPEREKVTSRTVTCWRHMPEQRRHYKVRDYEVGKQRRQETGGWEVRLGKSRNEKAA